MFVKANSHFKKVKKKLNNLLFVAIKEFVQDICQIMKALYVVVGLLSVDLKELFWELTVALQLILSLCHWMFSPK